MASLIYNFGRINTNYIQPFVACNCIVSLPKDGKIFTFKNVSIQNKYEVKGYPTLEYDRQGEREKKKIKREIEKDRKKERER